MFCGVYEDMPEYKYEALDSSGKSVTGTSTHPNEAFARAKLEKLGLYPVKLTVIPGSITAVPKNKLWDGTFGDAFQWFLWGAFLPLVGLIGGLLNPEEFHPAFCIFAGIISLLMMRLRLRDGKWPKSGECSGDASDD